MANLALISRLAAPALLSLGLGLAMLAPATAQAHDALIRVAVNIGDVVHHDGYPYYRYGPGYAPAYRLVVVRDRHHRPTYYRYVSHPNGYGAYRGNAYGHHRGPAYRYSTHYVNRGHDNRYDAHARRDHDGYYERDHDRPRRHHDDD